MNFDAIFNIAAIYHEINKFDLSTKWFNLYLYNKKSLNVLSQSKLNLVWHFSLLL